MNNGKISNINMNLDDKDKENDKLHQKEIKKTHLQRVSYFKLQYKFADKKDIALIVFAVIGSLIAGTAMPFIALLLGGAINNFGPNISPSDKDLLNSQISYLAVIYILVGIGIFIGSFMMVFFWSCVGKRLILKINEEYLRIIMKQEPGWFDSHNVFELPTKIQGQIKIIENGIGNKVGQAIMSISQFIASFMVGYITSWQLSLVLTAMLPLLLVGGWCMAKAMQQGSSVNRESYEKAGGFAEEVIYNIKTVASFANFEYEKKKYDDYINKSMKAGIKSGFKAGFGIGFIIFVVYCSYSLAVGYGAHLIASQQVNKNNGTVFGSGDVITVLFSIIFGCLSLGQATPNIRAMYEAMVTAVEFFALLERIPQIDITKSVLKPDKDKLVGNLSFKNVDFSYPTNCEKIILNNFSVYFETGKKTAIVGASGSGKSTIFYLLLRFYEPNIGNIYFDDYDIKTFDLNYWRGMIGYVPQEPVLFNTSIRNNIIFGRENITEADIKKACEKAYADEFVNVLGLDYIVGIKGSRLSGGQKQRIAIARAILTKPKLLILDEATSALDNKSEKEVQKALDIVSQGVTTIIIAHKIETIMNSDVIICINDGGIVEKGKHIDLLAANGFYSNLVQTVAEKQRKERQRLHEREEEELARQSPRRTMVGIKEDEEEEVPDEYTCNINKEASPVSKKSYPFEKFAGESIKKETLVIAESIKLRDLISTDSFVNKKISEKYENKSEILSSVSVNIKSVKKNINFERFNSKNTLKEESIIHMKEDIIPEDPKKLSELRKRLFTILKNEKYFVIGGAIVASCNGAVWPIYGILLGDAIGTLSEPNMEDVSSGGLNVAMFFLVLAFAAAIVLWLQNYFFYGIGEILTKKFREMVFSKFLNFHMAYFDRVENSSGSLISRLSSDTTKINGIAISIIGQLLQTSVTLILGITLALVYDWRLCLINLGFLPLIILTYVFQFKVQKGQSVGNENVEMEAGGILSEAVLNTKTIFSYNMENKIVEFYAKVLGNLKRNLIKTSAINGIFYAFSQFIIFGMYATLFYAGGQFFFMEPRLTLKNMMKAILTILFSALGVGVASAFVGDYTAAKKAIVSIYSIIDEPSMIDVEESEKSGNKKINYSGKIEFRKVSFCYPTRPDIFILKDLSFIIEPGQHVAFVGSSGSGKSTIISLIERFYDVTDGEILIDDIDIRNYDLKNLRMNIGLVSQEPCLFKQSVKENIRYGKLDSTDNDVLKSAKEAYIDNLIEYQDLPVSGGQKQRIAIARAILKNPKILLLDEATSALDATNEELIKNSLDNLMKDKTSVVVAHRLSTIINSNIIFVLDKGSILEKGTHDELMSKKGKYYNLFVGSQ